MSFDDLPQLLGSSFHDFFSRTLFHLPGFRNATNLGFMVEGLAALSSGFGDDLSFDDLTARWRKAV